MIPAFARSPARPSGRPVSLRAALRHAGAACLLLLAVVAGLAGPAPAQDLPAAPVFQAYAGKAPGQLLLRVDRLPAATGVPFLLELALPGGGTRPLPRPYAQAQRLYTVTDLPEAMTAAQLRLVSLADGRRREGPWSAPQDVAGRAAAPAETPPGALRGGDWEIAADPDRSGHLRVRLTRLPDPGDRPLAGIRLRKGKSVLDVLLAPEPGLWQSVAPPEGDWDFLPGRRLTISAAALSAAGTGGWSPAREAATELAGPPGPPWAFGAAHWMLRPSGRSGEMLIQIARLAWADTAAPLRLEARHAPTDDSLDPAGAWSAWTPLAGAPQQGGTYRLAGLEDGRPHLVQLRLVTAAGPGAAGAPKLARTRVLDLPAEITLGALNRAGSGRVRVPKGARLQAVSVGRLTDWQVAAGPEGWDYLLPRRDGADLPAQVTLDFEGGHRLDLAVAPASYAAETRADVAAFLALPDRTVSGATLLIGAEWLDLAEKDFFSNRLTGLDAPLTVRPREPAHGTLISSWTLHATRPGLTAGHVRFEDLTFYYPEALSRLHGGGGLFNILHMAHGRGRFEDVQIRNCRVFSDAMPGRMGYQLATATRAIYLTGVHGSVVENCEVGFVLYGIAAGTEASLIRGNDVHHTGADPLNIYFSPGSAGAPGGVRDVVVEHNTVHDFMGDAWALHGDVLHMWMSGGGKGNRHTRIEGLRFRGNVGFPGPEGLRVPPRLPPAFAPLALDGGPGAIQVTQAHEYRILRVDAAAGPVVVTLPPADATLHHIKKPPHGLELAVQKADQGPHPVIIRRAPGSADRRGGKDWSDIELTRPWQAVLLAAARAEGNTPPGWTLKVPVPAFQGFFADDNDVLLRDAEFEGNILWGLAPSQILPRNRPQQGVWVHHNTLLTPFPGDRDGDGRYNTRADSALSSTGRISVGAWDSSVAVWANVAGSVVKPRRAEKGAASWNNSLMVWSAPASLPPLFPGALREIPDRPDSLIWSPRTRAEAIALARPAPGSAIAENGRGALGPTPQTDWWDFDSGRRAAGWQDGQAELTGLFPAPGAQSVSPEIPALEIELDLPVGAGTGEIGLYDLTEGTLVQGWDSAGAVPFADMETARQGRAPLIDSRRLVLPLAAPLPGGHDFELRAAPGALADLWGRGGPALPDWRFHVNADAAVNRLGSADPRDRWWGAAGWEELTAPSGAAVYTRKAGSSGRRLRLDSRRHGVLHEPGTWTLRFDYGPVPAGTNLRSEILMPASGEKIAAYWEKIRPGRAVELAPGIQAGRRDASAHYGLPPGRVWTAELTWTSPDRPPRRVFDLLQGAPDGAGMLLGRLMLHEGPPGRDWSAP